MPKKKKTIHTGIIITHAKDTIVLLGGENIEPAPIEDKLRESVYIDQVVILGQDQKFLSALKMIIYNSTSSTIH